MTMYNTAIVITMHYTQSDYYKIIIQLTHSDSYNKRAGLIKELITP